MTASFTVKCFDGRKISATKYQACVPSNGKLIIINSALGIKQGFYRHLSQFLAQHGYSVITWDPRGIGLSSQTTPKNDHARLRDWGQIDLDSILQHVVCKGWAEWEEITLVGHSAGGHLIGLCPSIENIKNIILISSGTCAWHLYPKRQQPKMLFAWYVWFPFLYKTLGYIPSKLGVGHALPKGIALDWRNWSVKKDYLFSDESIGELFYNSFQGKLHAIGFTDDVSFSPQRTIEDLIKRFVKSDNKVDIFNPKQFKKSRIGHFGFFNPKNQDLWHEIMLNNISP